MRKTKFKPPTKQEQPLTSTKLGPPSSKSHVRTAAETKVPKQVPPEDVYTFKSSSPVKAKKVSKHRDLKHKERIKKLQKKKDIMQGVLKVIFRTRDDIAKLRAMKKKTLPEP